jgi:predicted Rossmann-fold nucleotide-binding protein
LFIHQLLTISTVYLKMAQEEKENKQCEFKIISGGQTGADRAALDWAIQNNIPHGGWCPAGRKAEDGTIPLIYNLTETKSADYPPRTKQNLMEGDATVVFTVDGKFDRGTALTVRLLEQYSKPYIVINGIHGIEKASEKLDEFLNRVNPKILNIAGPRQSFQPAVYRFTIEVLNNSAWLNEKIDKLRQPQH